MEWGGLEAVINQNNGKTNPIQKSIHLFLVLKLCWLVTVGGKKTIIEEAEGTYRLFQQKCSRKDWSEAKGRRNVTKQNAKQLSHSSGLMALITPS